MRLHPKNVVTIAHDNPGLETSSNNTQVPYPTTNVHSTSGAEQGVDFVVSSNTAEATSRPNARSASQPPALQNHAILHFQIATPASPCNQRHISRSTFAFVMVKH